MWAWSNYHEIPKTQKTQFFPVTIFSINIKVLTLIFSISILYKFTITTILYMCFLISVTEHQREDNPDLYCCAEITRQHTKTFHI